jgi:glycosyltransferase involved in cell wall biosynthesis
MRPQLLLTCDFPPMEGGAARWMGALARHWPRGELVVSTGQVPESEEFDEQLPNRVDRLAVPVRRLRTLQGILAWSRHASVLTRALDPDFIWCGALKPAAYPAKWVRERAGTPFGVIAHAPELLLLRHQTHRSVIRKRVARGLLDAASVVATSSAWTRDLCLSVLGELGVSLAEDRVRVVPLGTDPDFFRPGIDCAAVREKYRLDEGRWVLTVTRPPYRGIEAVLQAIAAAPAGLDLRYLVVQAGEAQTELKALVKKSGVGAQVRILANVPESDHPALCNVASAYVGLSRQPGLDVEGIGSPFVDAAASGLPILAARGGDMPELVVDGETGLLADPDRTADVLGAIKRLLDPGIGAPMGRAGRARVEGVQGWERVVGSLRAIGSEFAGDVAISG